MDEKDMRALIHMKKMIRIVKSKKYFDDYLKKMERYIKITSRGLGR